MSSAAERKMLLTRLFLFSVYVPSRLWLSVLYLSALNIKPELAPKQIVMLMSLCPKTIFSLNTEDP